MELAEGAYRLTEGFPEGERFGLVSQMRRAAVSVASNIAEGAGRSGPREFLHHLSIARGSLLELETQVALAVRLQLLPREAALGTWELCQRVGKMLNRLMMALRKKAGAAKHTKHGPRTTDHAD
jgi:four helix bundle protein